MWTGTKEEKAKYQRGWYQKNKVTHKKRTAVRKIRVQKENKIFMKSIKEKLKCSKCGYNEHHAALDFHHIDESTKKFNLGEYREHSQKSLLEEIEKCIVLCAICHRIYHYEQRNGPLAELV